MPNLPDVIVALWTLPVVVHIVLPLAMLVVYAGQRFLRQISGKGKTVVEPMANIGRRRTGEAMQH
jgi:membrane protein implicated in regulation of membrane protease activity